MSEFVLFCLQVKNTPRMLWERLSLFMQQKFANRLVSMHACLWHRAMVIEAVAIEAVHSLMAAAVSSQ